MLQMREQPRLRLERRKEGCELKQHFQTYEHFI